MDVVTVVLIYAAGVATGAGIFAMIALFLTLYRIGDRIKKGIIE